MTGNNNRKRFAVRTKGMAGFLACSLALLSPALVLGQAGLILPPQADQAIRELTTLVVTNTAVGTNLPPAQSGTVVVTNRLGFSYADRNALLADGWSFMAKTGGTNRNTETTSGLVVDYNQTTHPGSINIPCDLGDLWEMNNNRVNPTRNFLSRTLSPYWTNIDLTITFYADTDTQQAGIALYQDDDNFMWVSLGYSNDRGSHPPSDGTYAPNGTNPSRREYCVWEYDGRLAPSTQLNLPVVSPHVHGFDWIVYGGLTHKLRLSRPNPNPSLPWSSDNIYQNNGNPNIVSAYWSPYPDLSINPVSDIGDPGQLYGYNVPPKLVNPRIGIWTGCGRAATPGATTLIMNELEVISVEPAAALHYSLINPPTGATIDANGIIIWTPTETHGPGTNVFTTVVTYTSVPPLSATNSFTVVVAEVNTAPTLPPQPDLTVSVLNPVTVANAATDTDIPINPLSYQLTIAPAGATISAAGIINWTPGADQQRTTNLFITVVTDSNPQAVNAQHLSATNSFAVVVLPPPGPVLPIQASRSVVQLTTLVVTNTATDGDPTVPQIGTNTILFNYADRAALLGDGWSFIGGNGRNTEYTAGQGGIDYNQFAHAGVLNIPCDQGDLYQTANSTHNTLFRTLPSDWQSVRLALTFTPVVANYQQAHLGLYQDDDNYMQMGVAYSSWYGVVTHERFTMDLETGGTIATPVEVPTSNANLYFRLDKNSTNSLVTCYYSYDGAGWTFLGATNVTFPNPRLMIWTGGSGNPYVNGMAVMGVRHLDMVAGTTVPTALSYTLVNPPTGATIDGNGIITWQPGATNALGSVVFTTIATDNGLPPLRATNSFTVTVVEPPKPPTIKSAAMLPGALVITWDCAIGSTYRLQYKDDLRQTNWLDLLPDMAAAGHTMTTTNYIGSSPARFFRALLLH